MRQKSTTNHSAGIPALPERREKLMSTVNPPQKRKRGAIFAVILGIVSTFIAALAFTPAFSGFTASINNTNNSVASGTLLMSETQGATTCLSSAAGTVTVANAGTCATINKLSGQTAAVPGTVYTSTVTIKNTGTIPANTFTLTPGGCATTANGAVNGTDNAGFCGKVNVTIADTTGAAKCVLPAGTAACAAPSSTTTLASIGTTPIALATPVAPNETRTYTFSVQVDNSATNAHQGLTANDTLTWAFAS
jgi:hypothetical protein